jgi:hypothetical protein
MYKLILVAFLAVLVFLFTQRAEGEAVVEVIEVKEVKPTIKEYAEQRVNEVFGSGWKEFEQIIEKESGWKVWGHHYPKSNLSSAWGACGTILGLHKVPEDFKTNKYTQISWCVDYVQKRYKTPQKALEFHRVNGWF